MRKEKISIFKSDFYLYTENVLWVLCRPNHVCHHKNFSLKIEFFSFSLDQTNSLAYIQFAGYLSYGRKSLKKNILFFCLVKIQNILPILVKDANRVELCMSETVMYMCEL